MRPLIEYSRILPHEQYVILGFFPVCFAVLQEAIDNRRILPQRLSVFP